MATTFLNGDYSRIVPIVSSFFTIKDTQINVREDSVEFLVTGIDIKNIFPLFLRNLASINMVATAKRSKYFSRFMPALLSEIRFPVADNSIIISVYRLNQKSSTKRHFPMPLAFFIITVICVFFDGLSRSGGTIPGTYVSNPIMMAAVYTMSLMGILGTHELGHMIALKHYEVKASWPYFIPGIPSFVPTFGALITQRSNMPNRNIMFDVGISGPVAGLIITMIVSIYGSSISSLIPAGEFHRLHDENRLLTFNTSLIMVSTLYLMGKMAKDMVLVMSPVLFTAWIGFALTSVNLTPAWQLDGGHLARAALGRHKHRIVTYIGVGYLFVIGFWPMAILVLVLSFRIGENPPLDDVSPLSQRRKLLFLVAIGLAIVTAPIPTSIIPWA